MEIIKVKIGWSGDNYSAIIEGHDGIVVTTHKKLDKLKKEIVDLFLFHLDEPIKEGYSFEYTYLASAKLKQLDGILTRKALSDFTGINEKQLGHYIQGKKEARPKTIEKINNGLRNISKQIESVV